MRDNFYKKLTVWAFWVKIIVTSHKPLYLTWIEGPPPKRNVVRSSRARGATKVRTKQMQARICFVLTFFSILMRGRLLFYDVRLIRQAV